jgi:soluble lytic murein transglycosylase-like protein
MERQCTFASRGKGMAQFMPATANWIAEQYPDDLGNAQPTNPSWAIRALVQYDFWLYTRIRAKNACERLAFTLSAYNGGLGWVNRDKTLASGKGLDPLVWFGSVERVNAGRSPPTGKKTVLTSTHPVALRTNVCRGKLGKGACND